MPGLAISDIVKVQINMAPTAVPLRNFGALLIAGDSDVIDVSERIREYSTLDEVVSDFGSTAPEYLAADLFFSQNPQPSILYIGRFAQTASSAILHGGLFTPTQAASLLLHLQGVTNGTFQITIDGVLRSVSATAATLSSGAFTVTDQNALVTTLGAIKDGAFSLSIDGTHRDTGPIDFTGKPTSATLVSALFTPAEQPSLITQMQGITSGALSITIDGTARDTGVINFSTIAALADVASHLQTALSPHATVAWNSTTGTFTITSAATGSVSTLTYATAGATGTDISSILRFNSQSNGILTQGEDAVPIADLNAAATLIQAAIGAWATCKWSSISGQFVITSITTGTASSITVAGAPASGTDISADLRLTINQGAIVTVGGAGMDFSKVTNLNGAASVITAALAGGICTWDGTRFHIEATSSGINSTISYASPVGTGQDVSLPMKLTSSTAIAPVEGIDAETPLAAAAALRAHPEWYGLTFAVTDDLTLADYVAVAQFIEGCYPASVFGYTTQDSKVLDDTVTDDIASTMQSMVLMRTFGQYSSSSPYAVASMYGRAFTTNFEAQDTMITLKFKREPGVSYELLTENESATLKAKCCNVFTYYSVGAAIIQEGVMANGFFFDEVQGLDWLANRIGTDLFNVLYTSTTKVPQTDAGVHILTTTVAASCQQGVVNGLLAGGQWNGPSFGSIKTGQQLPSGFYVFAPAIATQPQAIRETRRAPTIQVGVKLAGAIHFADAVINVNR